MRLILACCSTTLCEYRSAVAVLIRIDDIDRVIKCVGGNNDEYRAEYLFTKNRISVQCIENEAKWLTGNSASPSSPR